MFSCIYIYEDKPIKIEKYLLGKIESMEERHIHYKRRPDFHRISH
jgi:hypothetical protein